MHIYAYMKLNHFLYIGNSVNQLYLTFFKKAKNKNPLTLNLEHESCLLKGKSHTEGLQKKPSSRVDKDYTKRDKSGPAFPAHRRKHREECDDHREGGLGGFSQ